ncbi:unnamed protein product [Symbiodinium necroappetens]|uniref:EF-hand domain-containing protein n=1 Tax=Symbiodinium necroappetens TaxID=1628268 RepID=A0A812JH92_9DINO|nr:unnamed protein product [Symbiodinium necroappetens]
MEHGDFAETIDRLCDEFREKLVSAYESLQAPPTEAPPTEGALRGLSQRVAKSYSVASSRAGSRATSRPISRANSKGSSLTHSQSLSARSTSRVVRSETNGPGDGSCNPNMNSMTSSSMESDHIPHGDSSTIFRSVLAHLTPEEARTVRYRLRWRLGAMSSKTIVSGKHIHDAVSTLGLTTYSEEDMNEFVNLLADFIKLSFEAMDVDETPEHDGIQLGWFSSDNMAFRPVWAWPEKVESEIHGPQLKKSVTQKLTTAQDLQPMRSFNVVPAQALMEVLLATEGEVHKKIFGSKRMQQFRALKEILLAADTNRLVAELTFVRINDLAGPAERTNILTIMEPLVALLIVANGVMIGLQTHPGNEDWSGWPALEAAFTCALFLEIGLRMYFMRCRNYCCGPDRYWSYFDVFLAATGLSDAILQAVVDETIMDANGTSLLRFCRLIRLVRIVKVFRIKAMRDLRLMVKGLIAGVRTLSLAFLLLFGVLYVISGLAAITIGSDSKTKDLNLDSYFSDIPQTMFTAFRCFTGECTNEFGHPILIELKEAYGLPFVLSYVISYMLVSMGIFNVILAVYVDITMKAAKENDAVTAEQYSRESVRVARATRELLKKFQAAYHKFHEMEEDDSPGRRLSKMKLNKPSTLFAQDGTHDMEITKEMFLLIIQDRSVQKLMNELDLPPDRANMFEIIDADGSGTLQLAELLHGLLKMRGDISKSDAVAAYLATKAVQDMLTEIKEDLRSVRSEAHRRTYQPPEPFSPGSGVSEGSFPLSPLGPLDSPKEPAKHDPEPELTPGLSGVQASQKPEVPGGELSQPPSPKAIQIHTDT